MGNVDCCNVDGCKDRRLVPGPESGILFDEQPDGDIGSSLAMMDHKLLKAARSGDVAGIQKMLIKGADIETRCPFWVSPENVPQMSSSSSVSNRGVGLTPLMCAAQGGYAVACKVLIAAGASVNAEDEDGLRPLHFAASSGSWDTCKALLERRAVAAAQDDEGRTAMALVPPLEVATPAEKRRWRQLLEPDAKEGPAGGGGSPGASSRSPGSPTATPGHMQAALMGTLIKH